MPKKLQPPQGVGLGFRFALAEELLAAPTTRAQFIEIAPENYLNAGGRRSRILAMAAERWPVVCHGLCGDFAGSAPLDRPLLDALRDFLRAHDAHWYSDHLCLTHLDGIEAHDLLPLPFTDAAVERAAARVRDVQEILGVPVAIENVSAYLRMPGGTMDEAAFVSAVAREADCRILLDVNNIYVNAVNFGFDARATIDALPLERVVQIHMAGHDVEHEGLLVDTHGAPIVDPVFALLAHSLERIGRPVPVLLERDHNIPPLAVLEEELARLSHIVVEATRANPGNAA